MVWSALRAAYAQTLAALDIAGRTADALEHESLEGTHGSSQRVVIVALGKSAAPMLTGAVSRWPDRIARVIVARPLRSMPVHADVLRELRARGVVVEEFASGHPLPDAASERAGRAALAAVASTNATSDRVLVLLSGGASAAACVPRDGVVLEDLRALTGALLAGGEPVEVINAARGSLDALKHGGLSVAAGRTSMLTLIAADVLGDDDAVVHAVGSAPTVIGGPDPAWLERARHVSPPRLASLMRGRHIDAGSRSGERSARVIATPATARSEFASALIRAGFTVRTLRDSTGDVGREAEWYASCAVGLANGEAAVAVGEPTVTLGSHPGRGGRASRLALLVAQRIDGLAGIGFLAGATDGVDGESGHAGAVVTSQTMARARAQGIDVAGALAAFDDAPVHEALGTVLTPGPTGINLLDVSVVARRTA